MNILNIYNKTLIEARNPLIFENYIDDNLNNKILIFLIFLSKNSIKLKKLTIIIKNFLIIFSIE